MVTILTLRDEELVAVSIQAVGVWKRVYKPCRTHQKTRIDTGVKKPVVGKDGKEVNVASQLSEKLFLRNKRSSVRAAMAAAGGSKTTEYTKTDLANGVWTAAHEREAEFQHTKLNKRKVDNPQVGSHLR
jgi:hypothetical protein